MLLILIQWILLLYTLIGCGSISISIYNKLAGRSEAYSAINTWIIGLCSLIGILSILRIFIPINIYFYGILLTVVSIHFIFQKEILRQYIENFRQFLDKTSTFTLVVLLGFILFFVYKNANGFLNFDASCYHLQASKWIETYPLVSGIANIEERLGFNSTFHLLSAPFSLSALFSEPIFFLHPLFFILLLSWSIYNISTKRTSVFFMLVFLALVDINYKYFAYFFDSNTDILPNLLILYLIVYLSRKVASTNLTNQSFLIVILSKDNNEGILLTKMRYKKVINIPTATI